MKNTYFLNGKQLTIKATLSNNANWYAKVQASQNGCVIDTVANVIRVQYNRPFSVLTQAMEQKLPVTVEVTE